MIWVPRKKILVPRKYQRGSVGHAGAGIMTAKAPVVGGFSPYIQGRVNANGYVVYANDADFQIAPVDAFADDRAAVWLIKTSDNCYIRCGRWISGFGDQWYNTAGAGQGDPGIYTGTGTTIFTLGAVPDTVNIYNSNDNSITGTPGFGNVGTSYTSDDKSTFFSPTVDTKYGRYVDVSASVTANFGSDTQEGETTVQFTFRKSGETDYTITFRVHARAQADVEP